MVGLKNKPLRYTLQAVNYTIFMGLIWYFATSPSIRILAEDEALITIAFPHAGDTLEPCQKRSSEELAKLAPNMRKLEDCPRERSPVIIEATLNGKPLYAEMFQPPGLFKDGGVDIYFNGRIPAGEHEFEIKMNDSARKEGFNHVHSQDINIKPAHILLVSFEPEKGFIVK